MKPLGLRGKISATVGKLKQRVGGSGSEVGGGGGAALEELCCVEGWLGGSVQ